jgi:hypothetical protein
MISRHAGVELVGQSVLDVWLAKIASGHDMGRISESDGGLGKDDGG